MAEAPYILSEIDGTEAHTNFGSRLIVKKPPNCVPQYSESCTCIYDEHTMQRLPTTTAVVLIQGLWDSERKSVQHNPYPYPSRFYDAELTSG